MSFKNYSPVTDLANLNSTLEEHGVAVIPNLFTDSECEFVKQSVFKYLAERHSIHGPNDYEKIRPIEGGIIHRYGISLLKEILDMKTDERVVQAFERIWNNEQVTMSMDGLNITPPPESRAQSLGAPASFHTDQSSNKSDKCCVQALINLEHTEDGDGCLSVLRYSHKLHQKFFQHFDIDTHGVNWYVINPKTHYDWFIKNGCEWNKILAPKGSLVFWDSRTIHKGTAPMQNRTHPDRWRFVIYVCFTPARFQTKEDTEDKMKAYKQNRLTSHWPYGFEVFPSAPDDKKVNSLDDLSDRHKKFLGFI